jgi:ATP-dependent Clp protease protease subunit
MNLIKINNRKGKLKLNDAVHKGSADKLIEELDQLYGPSAVAAQMKIGDCVCAADDALESVEVEINSPGGSVFEGQRIYSALREMSARGVQIITTANGLAASMGSVILMGGDVRRMTKESRVMIHEPSTIAMGDARAMAKAAELLEGIAKDLVDIYAERTGMDAKHVRDLMLSETYMDSTKAQELGFIHEVVSYKKKPKEDASAFDTKSKGMSILAKLFPGNDEVAKLEAAISDAESLRNDLTAAQARIEELAPLAEANATMQTEVNDLSAKLTNYEKLAAESAQKITDLEAAAVDVDKLAAVKASELLAAQGHPAPVSLVGDTPDPVNEITLSAFNAKTPHEKMEFVKGGGKIKI